MATTTTTTRRTRFSRRIPDHVTDELVHVLTKPGTFEFNELFGLVYENLKKRNAVSGGEEMLRLRAYEKLQNLVSRCLVRKEGKRYTGLEGIAAAASINQPKPVLPIRPIIVADDDDDDIVAEPLAMLPAPVKAPVAKVVAAPVKKVAPVKAVAKPVVKAKVIPIKVTKTTTVKAASAKAPATKPVKAVSKTATVRAKVAAAR